MLNLFQKRVTSQLQMKVFLRNFIKIATKIYSIPLTVPIKEDSVIELSSNTASAETVSSPLPIQINQESQNLYVQKVM